MVETRIYCEACDASAAVRIGRTSFFAAASDEDNVLRVFDRDRAGMPTVRLDVTQFLDLDDEQHPEADIEGAALLGDRIYWIGSHGRNSEGEERRSRGRFFATSVRYDDDRAALAPVGVPYKRLLEDLLTADALKAFGLADVDGRAPEDEGGLNIEGLAATPAGELLIGFRNPVPDSRALLAKLMNPVEVADGRERARFEVGAHLDLGGRGIRALEFVPASRSFLIIAGSFDDRPDFAMFNWSGNLRDQATRLNVEGLDTVNPEELTVVGSGPMDLLVDVFSDDGTRGCKGVSVERRTFRGTTLPVRI